MSQILDKIRIVDPNDSDAVKECVTVFFRNLPKHSEHNRWLRALDDVLRRFPKYCISHRGIIESFIVNYLDSSKYHNVIEAAKCAHSLQQVRPSQEKTSTPKSCWRNQMTLLCLIVHNLIDKLFPDSPYLLNNRDNNLQDLSKTPLNTALAKITVTSEKYFDKKKVLIVRLQNIFVFIQAMLVEIYPVAKPIQPQIILDSILHALSIAQPNGHALNDIVQMKTEALRTLNALIACLGSHLIPYSPLVFRLVMQTLRWTSDNPIKETKSVRCVVYNSLKQWLSVLYVHKLADSRASIEDELTSHIINDITPPKKLVQLTMGPQPTKNLSKKAKRKLANTQLQESAIAGHMPGEKNKSSECDKSNEIAEAALECAESLFIVCGIFLKPTTHKIFQERLVRECFNLSSYSGNQALLFLRTLEACRKTSPNTVPPPTQYCLYLYSTNVNSFQPEIATFCSRAILDIRLHLHCSPPSLNFALQINEQNSNKPKIISEKNRVMLESLLGKNKLPLSDPDEIITIPDEPATKKSRLIEDAEKISLSSENISSVEISDSDSEVVEEISEEHESKDEETLQSNIKETDDETDNLREIRYQNISSGITEVKDVENELKKVDESTEADGSETIYNMQTQVSQEEEKDVPRNVTDINIHDMATQIPIMKEIEAIHEAPTQLPLNESVDSIDVEEAPLSLEIVYDYPSKITDEVPILEKIDDTNLPCSNETDDIQITCGQVLCISQEENKCEQTETCSKVNGLDVLENDVQNLNVAENVCDTKVAEKKDALSVEEMMADFVDEVQDDA